MSSGRPEREENALRIMRALSGVDEELLARSEGMDGAAETKEKEQGGNRIIVRFMNRHGRALAACLCLALLGAAYLLVEIQRGNEGSDGSGSGGAYIADNGMYEAKTQDKINAAHENREEAEGMSPEEMWDGMSPDEMWDADDLMPNNHTDDAGAAETVSDQQKQNDALNEQKQNAKPRPQELSLEEAKQCETLGAHIPETIPEGCDFVEATYEDPASGSRLVLTWSDGRHPFRVKLSQTLFAEPEEAAAETDIAVYSAAGEWEETFWQPEKSGRLQFAVLYEDGVLAEYEGYLGKEDILKMFDRRTAEE